MTTQKDGQVCGKPITEEEMCFEKLYNDTVYYACCSICFSILQEHPEKHTGTRIPEVK
jgi:YHS domain-containing protein